jgi:hypothetical protein
MATAPPPSTDPANPPAADPVSPVPAQTGSNGGATPKDPSEVQPKWRIWHTLSLLLIIVAIGVLGVTQRPYLGFLGTLVLLTAFTAIAGHGVVGLWLGVLIDERNKLSLSRLQMVLWTIVVLSGFLAAALWNVSLGAGDSLKISIPKELWLVMGISTTSLVGSPLILSTKTAEPPAKALSSQAMAKRTEQLDRTKDELERQGVPKETVLAQGKIVVWKWPWDARLSDLFQGDEIGAAAQLDLGKIQMFFFTLALVFTYGVALSAKFFPGDSAINSFPPLDESMVALLGISHAGFLTNKAIPHSTRP